MDLQGDPYVWLIVSFIAGFFAVRVGIRASRMVSNAAGYIVAGRKLPIYMVAAGSIVHALFPTVPLEVGTILAAVWVTGYTMLADTLLDFIPMFSTAGGVALILTFVQWMRPSLSPTSTAG